MVGVILPSEIKELMDYGITKIYSPDDGREMGLQGMINDLLQKSDFPTGKALNFTPKDIQFGNSNAMAQSISAAENYHKQHSDFFSQLHTEAQQNPIPILGITGTGGAGKSFLNR